MQSKVEKSNFKNKIDFFRLISFVRAFIGSIANIIIYK